MRIVGNDPGLSRQLMATASGAISAAGKPLAVNTDGTVRSVSYITTDNTEAAGTFAEVRSGHVYSEGKGGATFDSNSNKVVFTFRDSGNNSYGTAIVCTVASDNSISYGTPVVYSSVTATVGNSSCFDSNSNRVVIAFINSSDDDGRAIVGSVDGTSISFGTAVKFNGTSNCAEAHACFDSTNNKVIITFSDLGNSNYGTAVVGTVDSSDNSISFGSAAVFESATVSNPVPIHDVNANKIVIQYKDAGNSNYGTGIVGTISGTSISFGSASVYNSSTETDIREPVYDSTNNKTVFIYQDYGDTEKGKARVVTVSGTSLSYGTEATFESGKVNPLTAVFDSNVGKVAIGYYDETATNMRHITGTVSGTDITFGSELDITGDSAQPPPGSSAFDSNLGKVVYFARNVADSDKPYGVVVQVGGESTEEVLTTENFIGTSAHSAADGAKVLVNTQGAVDDNQSGLTAGQTYYVDKNGALQLTTNITAALGTASVYESAASSYNAVAYDSNSQRIVVAYQDQGNSSYGTAVVGTVSNSTISFGTPVVFNSGSTTQTDIAFDSSNNKVVIVYQDDGNSSQGTAIVGTVDSSDNSISFGSEAVFNSTTTPSLAITFDNNSNKVVVAYRDQDGSTNYGNAKVGTVSGTSISFGSEATFNSASTANIAMTFDSNSNKVVIAYLDYGDTKGRAVVGTVSGTSISFGSEVLFENADTRNIEIAFDSSNNKIVIGYEDNPNSTYGTVIVGDVDGTSISFGTAVVFNSAATAGSNGIGIGCDSTTGKTLIIYYDQGATDGQYIEGTVSGTSISFGTEATHISSYSIAFDVVEDTTNNKLIIVYQDASNSQYGTAQTYTPSQDLSGSLSTDAVTAGTALSATKLLVKG